MRDSVLINHALNGMNTMYVLWANDKLCDVTVIVEGKEFPAHSVVLATHSDYFLSLLLKEMNGATVPQRVTLGGLVSASGFGRLLGYMYTSEIELRWGNVVDTMQTACALSVTSVVELGGEFIQNYSIENCLSAMYVTKQANITSLFLSIRKFVLDNFLAVSRTKDYLQCPVEMVASILEDDNVNVASELEILIAAKNWIHSNGDTGLRGAPVLMRLVRFNYISSKDIEKYIEADESLMQIPEVSSKVNAVYRQRASLATASAENKHTAAKANKRPTNDKADNVLISSAQFSAERLHKVSF